MKRNSILSEKLQAAVSNHDNDMLRGAIDEALEEGAPVADMRSALTLGLEQVRHKLMSNDASVPEFLLCIDTVTEGLNRLTALPEGREAIGDGTPLVIGVVEGDPHGIGKNIIAAIYRAHGYQVFDLGCGVPEEKFLRTVEDNRAGILALSGMMSTTVAAMPDVIRQVKARFPDTVVMVGGAPLDETLARNYGADGYAETAVTVLEETELAIQRVKEGKPWMLSNGR